jgi:hypothetical protein
MSQNTTPATTNTTRGDPAQPAPGLVAQQYLAGPSSKGDLTGQPRLTHPLSQLPERATTVRFHLQRTTDRRANLPK